MRKIIHRTCLKVAKGNRGEVYEDIVRVPYSRRGGLKKGHVIKVGVADKSVLCILRGSAGAEAIFMDSETRRKLDVQVDREYDFTLESVSLFGEIIWSWNASDTAYRVASRLGGLSLLLGALSVILAFLSKVSEGSEFCEMRFCSTG
ncbi:MAG: hypothetical protein WD942_00365 [Dehalococcoidia bacterium]